MTVVVADFQTAGKGQGSNSWESEPGQNLLMSVRIHPTMVPPRTQFLLSEAGALAVGDTLSAYTGGIALKWDSEALSRSLSPLLEMLLVLIELFFHFDTLLDLLFVEVSFTSTFNSH